MHRFCLILLINFVVNTASMYAQGATRLWHFGTRAGIEFAAAGARPTSWVDTSYIAPGILHSGDGEALYYMLDRRCIDGVGRIIRAEGNYIDTCPWQPFNSPQSIMFRQPGSNRYAYSVQAHVRAYDGPYGTTPERSRIQDGAVTVHQIDVSGNDGAVSLEWCKQVLVHSLTIKGNSTLLQGSAAQTLVPHVNGRDLWLIVPLMHPKEVWTFLVTPNGIDTSAKVRSTYSLTRGFVSWPLDVSPDEYVGEIKVSPDITKIAFVAGVRGRIGLFDFDASTGKLSNEREFSDPSYWKDNPMEEYFYQNYLDAPFGIEFSSDSRKVYVTNVQYNGIGDHPYYQNFNPDSARGELVQYDITLPTADAIRASRQVIVPMSYSNRFGGLQLAPDGKIYIAQRGLPFVSRIENPNALGPACGFTKTAVNLLPGTLCGEGFPFVMATTLSDKLRVLSQDVCVGDTMVIPLAGGFITDSVRWDYGDATSPTNLGYGKTGRHYYASPGAYLATATMYVGSDAQPPVSSWVYVHPKPNAVASATPPLVCAGDTATVSATGGVTATWFVGTDVTAAPIGTGNSLTVTVEAPGVYTAIVETVFGCLDTTSVTFRVLPSPTVSLARDTAVCIGSIVTLTAGVADAWRINWTSDPVDPSLTTNGPTATFTARTNGSYTINASGVNGCIRSKTIRVTVLPLPTVVARGDTTICRPSPVSLSATGARSYTWLDEGGGSVGIGASLTVTPQQTTKYVVVGVDSNGCTNTDTVTVTLRPDIDLAVAGDNISCDGQPITLVCSAPSGVNESDIMWLDETGATFATGKSVTVLPTRRTVYRATLPGAGECTDTVVHEIKVGTRPQFTVTPTDTTVCAGDSVVVVSSTGKVITVPSQPGSSRIAITEEDSVGCATTMESWIRGITPDAIAASLRDTTVDIGNGTTTLHVNIIAPQQFVGTTLGSIVLRVTHKTRSIKVENFIDARTGATLTPSMQGNIADRSQFEVTVPTTTLTSTTEPLLNIEGLPLIDDDSTSNVDVQILSIAGLGACTDSSSKGGLLTITGCGRGYMSGLRVGSELSVKAYPNPTSDNLTVAVDVGTIGTITIDLIDALGQRVMSSTTTRATTSRSIDTHMIDMQNIPAGTYRVVVSTPVEVRTVGVVRR